jgi:two-component sensor histidine kinase
MLMEARPGPPRVILSDDGDRLRLIVSDDGVGRAYSRRGYGSRMMEALVTQLGGTLEYEDARRGTRAILLTPNLSPRSLM